MSNFDKWAAGYFSWDDDMPSGAEEKIARDAYEAGRRNAAGAGDATPIMPSELWVAINDWHQAKLALAKRRASGELMNADYIDAVTAAEQRIDVVATGVKVQR